MDAIRANFDDHVTKKLVAYGIPGALISPRVDTTPTSTLLQNITALTHPYYPSSFRAPSHHPHRRRPGGRRGDHRDAGPPVRPPLRLRA